MSGSIASLSLPAQGADIIMWEDETFIQEPSMDREIILPLAGCSVNHQRPEWNGLWILSLAREQKKVRKEHTQRK